jgi:hypothetical protein
MSFRRVVIALEDTSSSTAAALATAIGLARTMEAELVGLFIEDSDLIEFAALPFAGEIGFPSAARRALDVEAMERSLRAQARRIRRELGERLAGQPVKWTFEVVRGRTVAALASAVAERDLVVISVRRSALRARAEIARAFETLCVPLLMVGESHQRNSMMAVIAPPHAAVSDIADDAVALARYYGRSVLFVAADAERPHWAAWLQDIAERLAASDISSRFRVLADTTRGAVDRMLAEERPRLVVALAHLPQLRNALLDALPYPLLVLPQDAARAQDGG